MWRDDNLVEIINFMDGQIPGIELYKLFFWADRESGYLQIQICIESTKMMNMIMIKSPE